MQEILNGAITLQNVNESWKQHKGFVMEVMKIHGSQLRFASDLLRDDLEIVNQAIQQSYTALQYASNRIKNDFQLVNRTLANLFKLPTRYHTLQEVLLAAIEFEANAFDKYVSEELKNDREFVLAAVATKGRVLQYVNEEFRNDPEIVKTAFEQHNSKPSLDYVGDELAADFAFMNSLK